MVNVAPTLVVMVTSMSEEPAFVSTIRVHGICTINYVHYLMLEVAEHRSDIRDSFAIFVCIGLTVSHCVISILLGVQYLSTASIRGRLLHVSFCRTL